MAQKLLRMGIDVGSTTVKILILDTEKNEIVYNHYERHHAEQWNTAQRLLSDVAQKFPGQRFRIAICGSGGKPISDKIGAHFVQEVVANSSAVRALYPQTRTAIELGGQDAKIIFFYDDDGRLVTSDMRMNGSCAGGTGAFIDEIASLLKVPTEQFEGLAAAGTEVHSISGRCGVFAKTDIQSMLNQGVKREDIALSAFHAIVKQTVGGLAQGLELKPPIIFEGGPLTYDHTLVKAFAEKLNLKPEEIIRPEHPETIVARGAAIALDELFPCEEGSDGILIEDAVHALDGGVVRVEHVGSKIKKPYFENEEECRAWREAHKSPELAKIDLKSGDTLNVYIGIDAGSTTSKMVLMTEDEKVFDRYYANNRGDPINVVRRGLMELHAKYEAMGVKLNVLGLGTTGYGELLIAKAYGADYHTVETVAHATAARRFVPDVSFILDIGGQDMKGIWVSDGIITNITLNEACSSGCGSFLENFASSLKIPTDKIADAAFRSKKPADLGSRCTVFMNSTIITEQKNGCGPDDIMAGLCRSIIENVFTKVVRISNTSILGNKIVVQGGTFKNDAVLRSLEQYLGVDVQRAPYPGEMGCIGAALLTKEKHNLGEKSHFIGFDALESLSYTQRENVICSKCANHCSRSLIQFSNGTTYITGNRCARGEVVLPEELSDEDKNIRLSDGDEEAVSGLGEPEKTKPGVIPESKTRYTPDLFLIREQLLFKKWDYKEVSQKKNITIGLPRTLEFWDSMPFWSTFFRSLGYDVILSHKSSREMFENGIPFVPSDTVCFPAKLAHGHIQDLVKQFEKIKENCRIFMPMVMEMPATDKARASNYVCAVVKGYPLIISHSENPARRWNVPFDNPMFHWYSETDRKNQILNYFNSAYGLPKSEIEAAFEQGETALKSFRAKLREEGQKIIDKVTEEGSFAVVLAGRPYHTDALVSHDLSRVFTKQYIPVLTVDSLPELNDVNLRYTRAEVTNNFHTRMLSGALLAAKSPVLEYVQIVSFGCGHDAILSDEIIRIMNETSEKSPLILKLDEGGAANSLNIRVKSFIETITERRAKKGNLPFKELGDAYSSKFSKEDLEMRTVLIPNVSVAFCKLLSGVLRKQGLRALPLSLGENSQIQVGKKYVHNDTCFPAQMVIGEAISALQSGKYPLDRVAIGMAKYQGDCRLSHYSALLRRALDAAGFNQVPIVSTDPVDSKNMHPGFRLGALFNIRSLWVVTMMDMLEELRRQIRPYELNKGETNRVFDEVIDDIALGIDKGISKALKAYKKGIKKLCQIKYDRSNPRPRVFVTGEYLVTFHPGSNFHVERYLEENGMEVILPRMANVFRKDFYARVVESKDLNVKFDKMNAIFDRVAEKLFGYAQKVCEKEASQHPLFEKATPLPVLAAETDEIMNRTFLSGEGWLIPGEIKEYALRGVQSFVILQPFGCLPNHICGRGIMKKVKEEFPAVQILPLDLDPDTSFANVENRLQMLIMNEKSRYQTVG
ncbi:acyl-CoA dehydratase activase [uncultured Treponema sp.]|uniref:acyl-CoA dehydratase activase n=1 Tax=uncultured Treponema sp. TaxID=162155 RepID=UPI0025F954A3|nr:acyl-CoA dehydratase activase [uncultured Treponema sp.]